MLISSIPRLANDVFVNGYYDSSHQIYKPFYFRSPPNESDCDNYSTLGNVNHYTGQLGTHRPRFCSIAEHPDRICSMDFWME